MRLRFNQGSNTIAGLGELSPGELLKSVGAYYRPNDPRLWKQNGRSLFADTGPGERTDVALCQFDAVGSDRLLALSNGTLYSAAPGLTGTFATLLASLAPGGSLITAHADDTHYLVDGVNINLALESDGSIRGMGMVAPPFALTATPQSPAANEARPTAVLSGLGWDNDANAIDADEGTFASAPTSVPSVPVLIVGTWAANAAANRSLSVRYQVVGSGVCSIRIRKSEDGGSNWTVLKEETVSAEMPNSGLIQSTITANNSLVQVEASMLNITTPMTFRIYDVKIASGATGSAKSTTTPDGIRYAFTEWDDAHGNAGPVGAITPPVTFTAQTQVRLILPATAANGTATHWRIYRTPDGGAVPNDLGWIADLPILETVFVDDFTLFDINEQPAPPLPMVGIEFDGEVQYYPRDTPPPLLSFLWYYRGGLLGISPDSPRTLFMALPSRPESWPEINVISSFPFPEHDELIAGCNCGDTAIIGARGLMIALDDVPRVTRGVFNASEARPLAGQPGLVGKRAICAFSVAGEARAAWVSRFGIHETNGTLSRKLTDDIDWHGRVDIAELDSAVLTWDPDRQVLIFGYTGINPDDEDFDADIVERYALIHMAEAKETTGLPKITWGHAGRISSIAAGEVSGVRYIWSGHVDDGRVYVENSGGADASLAFNAAGAWPLDAQTDQIYDDDGNAWEVYRGRLSHSDSGTEQELTIECRTGRDSSTNEQARTKTVNLSRDRANDLYFGLAGEWIQFRVRHTGTARFALNDLWLDAAVQEPVGEMLAP